MGKHKIHLDAELEPESLEEPGVRDLPVAPVAPAAAPQMDTAGMQAMIQALTQALTAAQVSAIEQTKEKPRSREDWEYHRQSHYNPKGDLSDPRPTLECETFYGVINEEDPSRAPEAYIQLERDTMTYDECVAANALQPLVTTIELNDGTKQPFMVYVRREPVSGRALRKLLCLTKACYGKDKRNSVPSLTRLWRQVQESAEAAA